MAVIRKFAQLGVPALLCASLSACGGGSSAPKAASLSMEGIASGFTGTLKLSNSGHDLLVLSKPGTFSFPNKVTPGSSYSINVVKQPPGQYCSVLHGSGTATSDVRDIEVQCTHGTLHTVYAFSSSTSAGIHPTGNLVPVPASDGSFYGTTNAGGYAGRGALFEWSSSGGMTLLHTFLGAPKDGASPFDGPTPGPQGSVYGVTVAGGTANDGTVYMLSAQGAESVVHSFTGGAGGSQPSGPLLRLANGNFVGVTQAGGAAGVGTLYEISPSGQFTVLHSFAGGSADLKAPAGHLLLASSGIVYGVSPYGGPSNGGGVFAYDPATGAYAVQWLFAGSPGGLNPNGGLLQASDGMLYGVTAQGGAYNRGCVYQLDPGTGAPRIVYSFTGGNDGAHPAGTPYQGDNGRIYVATLSGGAMGSGALSSMSTSGSDFETLDAFDNSAGALVSPTGALVEGPHGYLYGLLYQGGPNGDGAIYALD